MVRDLERENSCRTINFDNLNFGVQKKEIKSF